MSGLRAEVMDSVELGLMIKMRRGPMVVLTGTVADEMAGNGGRVLLGSTDFFGAGRGSIRSWKEKCLWYVKGLCTPVPPPMQ